MTERTERVVPREELPTTLEGWLGYFNDEYGEYLETLYCLSRLKYCMSESFKKAYEAEAARELKRLTKAVVYEYTTVSPHIDKHVEVEF